MGMQWGLERVDPVTSRPIDAEPFDPRWSPNLLDSLLVGNEEGPLAELIAAGETGCEHLLDLDWSSHVCPPALIPPLAVRRCHARLSGAEFSSRASREDLDVARWLSGYPPREQRALLDDLMERAGALRRFIAEAAARGHALRCHMR